MNPRYPVYIISKGRSASRLTSRALEKMRVPYRVVVEPQEYDDYAAVIEPSKILALPFSNLGQGSIPARNWCWEHAIEEGHERHWILDDNISEFRRLHQNQKPMLGDGTAFAVMEDFIERYTNVALGGPNYQQFAKQRQVVPPFYVNGRIYSCILIANDLPYRWRGRYNEDTDLSLRCLKAGYCTILFNAFLAHKQPTMTMTGGNTEALYKLNDGQDGRLLMAQSLQQQHPDVTRIVRKWGRWQHHVDYRRFRANRLIKRPGLEIPAGPNEYGMVLRHVPTASSPARPEPAHAS